MNLCVIVGNLTRDPEMRSTREGMAVCNFTVAVDGKDKKTDYFRVTCWRTLAENCGKYLAKGKKAAVMGHIGASAYTGRDGQIHASLELSAQSVQFLSSGGEQSQGLPSSPAWAAAHASGTEANIGGYDYASVEDEEELPF